MTLPFANGAVTFKPTLNHVPDAKLSESYQRIDDTHFATISRVLKDGRKKVSIYILKHSSDREEIAFPKFRKYLYAKESDDARGESSKKF